MGNLSKVPHTYFTTSNYLLSHISLSSAIPIFTSSHFLPIHPLRYENGSEFFTSSPKKLKASVETWDAPWQTVSKSIIFLLINHIKNPVLGFNLHPPYGTDTVTIIYVTKIVIETFYHARYVFSYVYPQIKRIDSG